MAGGNLLFLTPPCACCSPSFVPDPCASFLLRFFFVFGPSVDWSRRRIRRHFPFLTRKGAGVEPRHPAIILLKSQVRVPSPFPLDGSVARVSVSRPVIRREGIVPNPPSIPVFLAESLADPYADLAEFWIFLCSTLYAV